MTERWLPIPDTYGRYEVSDLGRIHPETPPRSSGSASHASASHGAPVKRGWRAHEEVGVVQWPDPLTATEAIAHLRRLIAIDGAFFPCIEDCDHLACEVEIRVLSIVERVR